MKDPQKRKAFRLGTIVDLSDVKIGVFWNMVECPIPEGMDIDSVVANITKSLKSEGDPDENLMKLLSECLCWAVRNRAPENILLIVGDIEGHDEITRAFDLVTRKRYNCMLAQAVDSEAFHHFAVDKAWTWDTLSSGEPALYHSRHDTATSSSPSQSDKSMQAQFMELKVEEIPSDEAADAKTIVYWDTVDCPIPEGLDAQTVVRNIYQGLYRSDYRAEPHFMAYGDVPQMASETGGFANIGIPMVHVPAGTKGGCRDAILVDFIAETIGLDYPLNSMLILGDISRDLVFQRAFNYMGMTPSLNFLLAQPTLKSKKLVNLDTVWLWSSLSQKGAAFNEDEE
ncbi:unnamed protein product [Microthlaspi erraticum]|uniref:NYN domain-containing protein n=1 Tax=Microthlaspi erraticum TaxID=1685480 RepID=A0A6D2ITP2_9BRAS|nr:unnamed protein product [Microthlaspi erraticum]